MFSSEYYEIFKGNAQFVQKVTFKPLMDFKKKKFTSPKLSKQTITFFETVLFYIFMNQTLIDDFGGLHKSMNCAFPLRTTILKNIS